MKKLAMTSLACLGILMGGHSLAQATPLIQNGSFESGASAAPFQTLNAGDNALSGWTVNARSIDWINGYWPAFDGTKSLDMAGFHAHGTISQSFTTVAGQSYLVTFDLAGNPDRTYNKELIASAGDGLAPSVASTIVTQTDIFNQSGHSFGSMGWTPEALQFTATSNNSWISFADSTPGIPGEENAFSFGAALDNVNVAPVPEPGTMMLLGAGFLGLAVFGKRRKNA